MNKTSRILLTAVVWTATFLSGIPGLWSNLELKNVENAIDSDVSISMINDSETSIFSNFMESVSAASLISEKVSLKDIKGHWVEKFVQEAISRWIVKGYPDGTFRPNNPVSSIESYKIAFKTSWVITDKDISGYSDWTIPYLNYYKNNNYDAGAYNPELTQTNELLSREKALYVLLRAKGINFWRNTEKSFAVNRFDTKFKDVSSWNSYAIYLRYAKDMGIVSWYSDGSFWFGNKVTRAEFVKMALGIFNRNDFVSSSDYITKLSKGEDTSVASFIQKTTTPSTVKNETSNTTIVKPNITPTPSWSSSSANVSSNLTYIENTYGKGLSFVDSTKVAEEWKQLFNNHWYVLQSDDYYESMNANKTPIKVAGSFWTSKTVYNTEEEWFVFVQNDGFSSSKSWNIQKRIDLIRYNENFYFQDLFLIQGWSLEEAPVKLEDVFSWVSSYKEFLTISNSILKQNNLYKDNLTVKEYLNLIANIYNNVKVNQFLSTLNLK